MSLLAKHDPVLDLLQVLHTVVLHDDQALCGRLSLAKLALLVFEDCLFLRFSLGEVQVVQRFVECLVQFVAYVAAAHAHVCQPMVVEGAQMLAHGAAFLPHHEQADDALRQALTNVEAIDAPAGEVPVVLSSGWCGGIECQVALTG